MRKWLPLMQNGATMRIKWLKAARQNLDEAMQYVAQDDPEAALRIYEHIRNRVAQLSRQPASGRPGRVYATRELVIEKYPYIVPYRVQGDEIHILRVFHTSQKPPQSW